MLCSITEDLEPLIVETIVIIVVLIVVIIEMCGQGPFIQHPNMFGAKQFT